MKKISTANIQTLLNNEAIMPLISYGYTVEEVIIAARRDQLTSLHGVGPVIARRIFTAVDRAGFIFHESPRSQAVRALFSTAYSYNVLKTHDYEAQVEFSEAQITEIHKFVETHIKHEREMRVITLHYGLNGDRPIDFKAIGRELEVSGERVRQVEAKALRKLRHPKAVIGLRAIAPDFLGFPEEKQEVEAWSEDRDIPIEERPLGWLPLPLRPYRALKIAGIETVGELVQFTAEELLR